MKDSGPNSTPPQNERRAPGTDLPLGRYAEALATVLYYRAEQSTEVIARLGMTPEGWEAAEKAWTEVLTCPGLRTDGAVALEFTSLFARARKRLGIAKPRISKVGPLPVAPPLAPLARDSAIDPGEPPLAPELPSYLLPAPARLSPLPRQYAATMALPIMRPDQVIEPAIPDHSDPTCGSTSNEDGIAETAEVDVRCFRAPLPFSGTRTKPDGEPGASPPPGKRLIRFDPQTGEPLSSPKWADVPVVAPAASPLSPPRREDPADATVALSIHQAGLVLPFAVGAPAAPRGEAKSG